MSQGPVQLVLAHLDFGGAGELRNVVLGAAASRPSSPATGAIFFNATADRVEYFDGATWQTLASEVFTEAAHDAHDHSAVASTIALNELGEPTGSVSFGGQRITNVATPTSSSDAATKGYVDSAVSAEATARAAAVSAETSARQSADAQIVTTLTNGFTQGANRMTAIEAVNATQNGRLDSVEAAVANLDGNFATDADVSAEASARQAADAVLQGNVDAVASDLADEADARSSADSALAQDIADEASARQTAVAGVASDLADETSRATGAEAALASDISDLANDLASEATARAAADTTLQSNIDAEATARANAVTAEATARQAADAALTSSLQTMAANNQTYAAGVTAAFTEDRTRLTALEAADVALDGRLDTIEADFATKAYVDGLISGLDIRESVKVAVATASSTSGTGTVDGVALSSGDRVLVLSGANAGLWTVASGAWTQDAGVDAGTFTFVEAGTLANNGYVLTAAGSWSQFSGAGQITAGDGLAKSGNELSVVVGNGLAIVNGVVVLDGPVSVENGGTGADNATDARANLGAITKFSQSIGNGTATSFTVTHGLDTDDVTVLVRKVSTGAAVFAAVTVDGTASVTVDFIAAPAAGEYRVVVTG
jgi:hypothetical protein